MPKGQNDDVNSLAHTKWNCKYHVVFAPKYRRKVFYEEKRLAIRDILRQLCAWKGVEILEGEICPDHVHLLLSIPPKMKKAITMVMTTLNLSTGTTTQSRAKLKRNLRAKYSSCLFAKPWPYTWPCQPAL